ncbi:glycosyltransferase family 4 protein [Paenibacillus xylaniclasticus]|uniref:glycosyltransferase family 4 protein n=1 Tax=Paenibacillus xylaniclasticus TaxID=588083 RepID=UPI000FD99D17|nr:MULTISPECIES: glycosyltransferase family 4 protein [Paenibacillus]GFN31020.1 glycosyl transferase family 1 [Paenibacillus curdlanolyticus]
MEVLFIFAVPSGGMDTLNRERIRALIASGIRCRLLYFFHGSGIQAGPMPCPVHYSYSAEEIKQLLLQHPPSLIVLSSWYAELYMLREIGYKGPLVFEIQGLGPLPEARKALSDAVPFIQPHADAVLYPGTPLVAALVSIMLPHKTLFSFPNPIDTTQFRYTPGIRRSTNSMPLLWIGRIHPNKGWLEYLQIARLLADRGENLELWMFEDPQLSAAEQREAFARTALSLRLVDRIKLLPNVPRPQMTGYFSYAADSGGMLLMTSLSEGAPYAVLEAMSCRCPVLTGDNDGVRIMIDDGIHGLYYTFGDTAGAADAAQRLRHDHNLRQSIVSHAELRVQTEFTPARYVASFRAMMRSLGVL